MRTLCIGGKNNIAIDVMDNVIKCYKDIKVLAMPTRSDSGIDTWQKSFRLFCERNEIQIVDYIDLYSIKDLIFISTEFDRIIPLDKFASKDFFNIHFSLLPKYKGCYPSVLPILNGESETGVTLHVMRNGIDTGEIIDQKKITIEYDDNSLDCYNKLIEAGTQVVIKNLDKLITGDYSAIPQPAFGSSYYDRAYIDFNKIELNCCCTAHQIHNQIRAFAFRPYQLLKLNGVPLIGSKITNDISTSKPGTILDETNATITISSIDYDIELYKDVFDDLLKNIECHNNELAKEMCAFKYIVREIDISGRTLLDVAIINKNYEMVDYLSELMALDT